jgi:hypothetical protein
MREEMLNYIDNVYIGIIQTPWLEVYNSYRGSGSISSRVIRTLSRGFHRGQLMHKGPLAEVISIELPRNRRSLFFLFIVIFVHGVEIQRCDWSGSSRRDAAASCLRIAEPRHGVEFQ